MDRVYNFFFFFTFQDAINCAEDYFKFLCKWVLDNCSQDMKFVMKRMDKTSIERLQSVTSTSIERITHTEALNVLKKVCIRANGCQSNHHSVGNLYNSHIFSEFCLVGYRQEI